MVMLLWTDFVYACAAFSCFQRREIVTGSTEPTDSDCDWPSDEEEEDQKLAVSVFMASVCLITTNIMIPNNHSSAPNLKSRIAELCRRQRQPWQYSRLRVQAVPI